jgi:hypothetical protein
VVVAALSAFSALSCAATVSPSERRGPAPERGNGPLAQTYLVLRPRGAATTAPGAWDVRVQSAYSSIFEVGSGDDGAVAFDGELWRTSIAARTGLGPRTDVEVELPFLFATSGFLDVFIETWHALFGLPDSGRETRPRFDYDMRIEAGSATAYELAGDRLGLADVPIVLTQRVVDEGAHSPAVYLQVALELPAGDEARGFGSGGLDWALGIGVERNWRDWSAGLACAYTRRDPARTFESAGLEVDPGLAARADAEWRWSSTSSLLLGLRYENAVSDSLGIEELGGDVLELDAAVALDGAGGARWMAGFTEDLVSASGADFTVFVGCAVSF